ncbi:hypothetical protein [Streptomyces chiangmaiensis]|uniref:Uncharacterized protein n=1 Tax=Streptomyces chiangmaiensis TaxID=766497 RepID=A0ABU7FG14_9ACTN|nr:hypothetical protein [Streptomyces chiangmaiensis]MED7823077.1 hypothetical protein [Streptomyces chiangmaiensis]
MTASEFTTVTRQGEDAPHAPETESGERRSRDSESGTEEHNRLAAVHCHVAMDYPE